MLYPQFNRYINVPNKRVLDVRTLGELDSLNVNTESIITQTCNIIKARWSRNMDKSRRRTPIQLGRLDKSSWRRSCNSVRTCLEACYSALTRCARFVRNRRKPTQQESPLIRLAEAGMTSWHCRPIRGAGEQLASRSVAHNYDPR